MPSDIPSNPVGSGEELTGDSDVISAAPIHSRRESQKTIYYKPREELTVNRVNAPTAAPVGHGQLPPEPIIRSLFDPNRTRFPAQAYTLDRLFPESNNWQQDAFMFGKVEQVTGADTPRGGFMDWANQRRNLRRDYPETYGDTVTLYEDEV